MKTIKISLAAICTIFATQLQAQTKIKVSDVSIQAGGLINPTVSGSNISLLTLAQEKESNLLKNVDLSNYKKYNSSNESTSTLFSILLGTEVTFRNKMKMNVRGGFTAFNNADMSVRYTKDDVYRIDTFTSSQTGQQFFLDSTRSDSYYISNVNNQLALDLSATFSTNKANKFSFYAGVGALVGFTYANYLDVTHSIGINDNNYSNNHQNYNRFWSRSSENEKLKLDNAGSTVAIFIPLGVEYRLSKKVKVLKNFSLYTELRPSYIVSRNSFSQTNSSINWMNMVGLRYHIF